jgi:serine/threonine-protein kinase HipA
VSTAWFANLLPEGEVRGHVARRFGLSERNDFGLLAAIGGECAGALSLHAASESTPPSDKAERRPLPWSELEEMVTRTPRPSLLALVASETELRLSLAGTQDKLPVCLEGDGLGLPAGGAASTHLLKVASASFPDLVHNELFCLELAGRIGLSIPPVRLAPTATPMLLIERYDRTIAGDGSVTRLHQEDLCQALGVEPESKYESEGGPGLADVFTLVTRVSRQPLADRRSLLTWVLFNDLIGNADAHGKNLSLLHGARSDVGAPALAPFYDLVCTAIYPELSRRQAMKIGGEARRERIETRHWQRFAESVAIRPAFLQQVGQELCRVVETEAADVAGTLGSGDVIARVVAYVGRQVRRLRADLERIT